MSHEDTNPESPNDITERLSATGVFDVKVVGPDTISAISIMGEREQLAGNVLRRLCKLGGKLVQKPVRYIQV